MTAAALSGSASPLSPGENCCNPDFTRDIERVARALEGYVPDLNVAPAPIAGRGPTVTRGAPLPGTQVASAPERQKAPPVVPVGAAVRSIRYPWMVRRLLLAHLCEAIGFIPLLVVNVVPPFNNQPLDEPYCTGCSGTPTSGVQAAALIGIPFWAVAGILAISMLIYALTTLWKQRRWSWFGSVLFFFVIGAILVGVYPYLGL